MSTTTNLNRLASALTLLTLFGCATRPEPLYAWGAFPRHQYDVLLREGASPLDQISVMNAHAEKAKASKASLPPGFRAHLGMLHLSVGNSDAARELWMAERLAFPESAPYMNSLLQKLGEPSKPVQRVNPS